MGIHKWEPDIYIGFWPALHLQCIMYEVSSKTNATDLLKTKWFKLESYFLQHKVSLIFRWFIQIIVLTPKHRRKAVVSRHSTLLLLTVPGQSYVNEMWTVLDRNLISSVKHSWISFWYRKITVLTINADKKRRKAAIRHYVCFSLVGIYCRRNRLVWAIPFFLLKFIWTDAGWHFWTFLAVFRHFT